MGAIAERFALTNPYDKVITGIYHARTCMVLNLYTPLSKKVSTPECLPIMSSYKGLK